MGRNKLMTKLEAQENVLDFQNDVLDLLNEAGTDVKIGSLPTGTFKGLISDVIIAKGNGEAASYKGKRIPMIAGKSEAGNPKFTLNVGDREITTTENVVKRITFVIQVEGYKTELISFTWLKPMENVKPIDTDYFYTKALFAINYELELVKDIIPAAFLTKIIGKKITIIKTSTTRLVDGVSKPQMFCNFNEGSKGEIKQEETQENTLKNALRD